MTLRHPVLMTDSTETATPSTSTESRNSNSAVQIQIKPKSQLEFILRDTEKSEFLDLVDFGGVANSVKTVIRRMSLDESLLTNVLLLLLMKHVGFYY